MKNSPRGCRGERQKASKGGGLPDAGGGIEAGENTEAAHARITTILFVDDEEEIAEMEKQILENFGFRVIAKTDCLDALQIFSSKPDGFDLVITDYIMPDRTGLDFAEELLRIRSDIPVVICTGYSEHTIEESAWKLGIRSFLQKPYSTQEILAVIEKVLIGC